MAQKIKNILLPVCVCVCGGGGGGGGRGRGGDRGIHLFQTALKNLTGK